MPYKMLRSLCNLACIKFIVQNIGNIGGGGRHCGQQFSIYRNEIRTLFIFALITLCRMLAFHSVSLSLNTIFRGHSREDEKIFEKILESDVALSRPSPLSIFTFKLIWVQTDLIPEFWHGRSSRDFTKSVQYCRVYQIIAQFVCYLLIENIISLMFFIF